MCKIDHSRVFGSVAFSTFTMLCSHHLCVVPKENLLSIEQSPVFAVLKEVNFIGKLMITQHSSHTHPILGQDAFV